MSYSEDKRFEAELRRRKRNRVVAEQLADKPAPHLASAMGFLANMEDELFANQRGVYIYVDAVRSRYKLGKELKEFADEFEEWRSSGYSLKSFTQVK